MSVGGGNFKKKISVNLIFNNKFAKKKTQNLLVLLEEKMDILINMPMFV